MGTIPTYEQALDILKKYNKEPFHIQHGETVGYVMRYFAKKYDPENVDFWQIVGLLHDLDFEEYPDEHCVKQVEIMKDEGLDQSIIDSTICHGYGMTGSTVKPEKQMEKILFASDELTGIIGAAALMRPSKSVSDMELKSLKKKFKDKKFAAGCSRDVIKQGAENLGWELDELLSETLNAMKEMESQQA
ncbi:hydrolase [Peptostreptococcus equinus]|uniref:Hydrolase n=1 Tax=Peptostreptococcus equinus TaxID=3003601 RepID=A0ABY7JSF7_9FIRM|nr:hydrolase [Peptostreptococcus sp. CBA3647]WAW14988.1 hydrolase [Peptostreptococcus sp. CBA3647]